MLSLVPNSKLRIVLATLLAIVAGVFVAGGWTFFGRVTAQMHKFEVTAAKQDDSPLLITSPFITSYNALRPAYGYSITNISDKPIRAYAIKSTAQFNSKNSIEEGLTLTHLPSLSQLLQPKNSQQDTIGGDSIYSEPVNEIVLSVDFVEFVDGSTWGPDTRNWAEFLAGQRAGGKSALKRFREVFESVEPNAFINQIEQTDVQSQASETPSQWSFGFRNGVTITRNRLKRVMNEAGRNGVKKELEKPFDASEGRRDK